MAKSANKPSKKQMRFIVKGKAHRMKVTPMESCLLDTLRGAQKARKNRRAYREWNAWECMKNDVAMQREGKAPSAFDLSAEPERFAAVAAIVAYLDTLENEAAPTSCEHEGKQAT